MRRWEDFQATEVDAKLAPVNVDHEILYADRSSIRPLLQKIKNTNFAGGWKLKFIFYFKNRTHEPLHLDEWSFTHWKRRDMKVLFESLFSLIEFWIRRWLDILML
jgi:hypothetical protein